MKKESKMGRHILSVILSLALVFGMITIPAPKTVSAEDTNLIFNGDFETGALSQGYSGATVVSTIKHGGSYAAQVTGGNQLMFTTDGGGAGSPLTANKVYKLAAYVYAEEDTIIEVFAPTYDTSWGDAQTGDDRKTHVSVTAGSWTLIEHTIPARGYDSIVQPRYFSWDGKTFYIDDITLTEVIPEITVGFIEVNKKNNSWYFTADNIAEATAQFYKTSVTIDGTAAEVVVEKTTDGFVIWPSFFTVLGGQLPTEKLEITAGTLLQEVASGAWATPVAGGQSLKVINDLTVEKISSEWIVADNLSEITVGFRWIATDNSWYFKADNIAEATAQFYKTSVTVDGKVIEVVVEKTTASDSFVIWPDFFTVIQSDGQLPTDKLEITAGTLLREIDPNKTGWATPVTGGQSLKVANNLTVCKIGSTWGAFSAVHDTSGTPVYFNIDNGTTYKVTSSNNLYEIKKGDTTITETELDTVGTYDITRVEQDTKFVQKVVLYKNGDVNADNKVDVTDLVAIKKLLAGTASYDLAGIYAADMNRSGSVDDTDARALRYSIVRTTTRAKADSALNGVMPIIGYDGPGYSEARGSAGFEADFINADIYSKVKDLGINTIVANQNEIGSNYTLSSKMLTLAEQNGIKLYLNDAYVSDESNADGITSKPDRLNPITAKYDGYASFGGYYMYDEPFYSTTINGKLSLEEFDTPMTALKNFTNMNSYLNLFPMNASGLNKEMGGSETALDYSTYERYVKKTSSIGADYLSYDMYLRGNGVTMGKYQIYTEEFYTNMAWMRKIAGNEGKPFYAFVQVGTDFSSENKKSTDQSNLTTVQEMYLEANAALAMGARGISYFSLIQPLDFAKNSETSEYDYYRSGLINIKGEANNGAGGDNYQYYNAAKKINTYIANVDEVLMNATNKGVVTPNADIAGYVSDALLLTSDKESGALSGVEGSSALVGCFDYYGKDAYMIVNTATTGGATGITLTFDAAYTASVITMNDTSWTTKAANGSMTISLNAGESAMVVLN